MSNGCNGRYRPSISGAGERSGVAGRFRGDQLARARERAGFSQSELASAVGVAAAERIARWERGDEQPRPQFIPLLAAALNVTALDLLDGDPNRPGLATLRLAAGLTVADLAKSAGISTMTYNRLERGTPVQALPPETLRSLAEVLHVSVDVASDLLPRRA
jgi:transcriptional regulator with XRE-family HTH domain